MSGARRNLSILALAGLAFAFSARPAAAQVTALNNWANLLTNTNPGTSPYTTTTASTFTMSAGTNRITLVGVCLETAAATTISTITVRLDSNAGTAFTQIARSAGSQREQCYLGRLLDAQVSTGAHAIYLTVTMSASTITGVHIWAGTYQGVDQVTPISSSVANNVAAATVSFGTAVTYPANSMTAYIVAGGNTATGVTHVAGFTSRGTSWNSDQSTSIADVTNASAGTYAGTSAVAWTGASPRGAIAVASMAPSTNTTATTVGTVTAIASGCSAIQVSAPYTGDSDGDNTLSYRTRTPSGSGAWSGTTAVAHSASPYSFSISGLTHGATYDVEVTYVDPDGTSGTNPQTISNLTVGGICTGAGTATAAATSGTTPSIALSAPYTFDTDGDNTLSYRYRSPSGSGAWTSPVNLPHAASPYAATISGLICGASYDVEVTYTDPDGIGSGTAVQTISNVQLTACTATGTVTATGGACGSLSASAPYTQDGDANNTVSYRYRTPTGTGAWSAPVALSHAASPYAISVTGLAAGSYDIEVTYADAAGVSGTNPQTVTNLSVTANCTTAGTATATATSCSAISVAAPFTGDSNNNGSTQVEVNTSNSWPGTTACAALTGASPRTCAVGSLANASAYWFRVTVTDADGVNGTNPQVIGPVSTLDCRVTPQAASATPDSCSLVTISAAYAGDADGDSRTNVSRGTAVGGPFSTAICTNLAGASPRTCSDATVAASSTYYYQVAFTDPDGIVGSASQVVGPATTPACIETRTTPGTASMVASGCRQLTVTAPFSGDGDEDGAVLVEINTTNTWTGTQSVACSGVSGPTPRMCLATGLTASTAYYVRVTFSDPDGLLGGTNPQVLGPTSTTACTGNGAGPMILPLAPASGAVVGGVERFRVQVYDPDGVALANVLWGVDGGTLANTGVTQSTTIACNLESQTTCKVFEFDLITSALLNGVHYVTVQATDSAAAPAAVGRRSWAFVVNNSGTAAAGDGLLLRRTHGSQICIDCHAMATHSSQATSFSYGSWGEECLTCHTPHETRNLYLVRETIQTPASGPKTLDFRNLSGKADFSFATTTTPGNGACEVCHTKTKNSDGTPRFRNSGGSDGGKHYSTNCVACHDHGKGFAAGESSGNSNCSGCHADIWNGMNGGVAKISKHTIGNVLGTNDSFTDSGITWADPLSGNAAAARSCVNMCHNDHPHTLTSPATTTHENNAYLDATSAASRAAASRTSSDKDKTDFESAAANGGMCISCHRNSVDASHPAISKAAYDSSAHDYVDFGTYGAWTYTQHDGGVFNRNCTKCHAGRNDARPGDTSIFFEAVHFSDYPSLLAGSTNPNGSPSTYVCYNCHGNGTTGVDLSGKNIATQIAKARNHPANADNVHSTYTGNEANPPSTWNNGVFSGTNRHASCLDCHDTHYARGPIHPYSTTATSARNQVSSPLLNVSGVQFVYATLGNFAAPAAANFVWVSGTTGATFEYQICFKCHTSFTFGTTPPNGQSANGSVATAIETDVAQEFNPNNRSGHPVVAGLSSYPNSTAPKALVAADLVAPWNTNVGTQTMMCSDCHNTDAASPAAQGPHGSAIAFMTRGTKTGWPAAVATTAGFATTMCSDCHTRGPIHSEDGAHQTNCYRCHIVIPHGGKMSRLMGDRDAASAMPARYAYNNDKTTMYIQSFTKTSRTGYGDGNCQASCTTRHNSAASENW